MLAERFTAYAGTEGSNPVPSSGESANSRSLPRRSQIERRHRTQSGPKKDTALVSCAAPRAGGGRRTGRDRRAPVEDRSRVAGEGLQRLPAFGFLTPFSIRSTASTSALYWTACKNSPISGFSVRFDGRGVAFPSFSAPVVSFYASRFGLYPNSGTSRSGITLSSVSDKQLM